MQQTQHQQQQQQQKKKVAVITGVNGQDGYFLAKFLAVKKERGEYEKIYGIARDVSQVKSELRELKGILDLVEGDICQDEVLAKIVKELQPDELYNLAGLSSVKLSYDQPEKSLEINGVVVQKLLEFIRHHSTHTRFLQAGTTEQFGDALTSPQNEETPFRPLSPYAASKCFASNIVHVYRKCFAIHASIIIMANHESTQRPVGFVTRKITNYVGTLNVHLKEQQHQTVVLLQNNGYPSLRLGNLDAKRDWGSAEDFVEAMYLILQRDSPDDYVIATGKNRTVRDVCNLAFKAGGFDLVWEGEGIDEKGYITLAGQNERSLVVEIDPLFFRPSDLPAICGDPSKAKRVLGWEPKTTFETLIASMVHYDIQLNSQNTTTTTTATATTTTQH